MVSKCPFGNSIPSPGAGTHIHLIKTDLQVKISYGLECGSFSADAAEHEVLPRCAYCNKVHACRSNHRLIHDGFPLLRSPYRAQSHYSSLKGNAIGALFVVNSLFCLITPTVAIPGRAYTVHGDDGRVETVATHHTTSPKHKASVNSHSDLFVNSPPKELMGPF